MVHPPQAIGTYYVYTACFPTKVAEGFNEELSPLWLWGFSSLFSFLYPPHDFEQVLAPVFGVMAISLHAIYLTMLLQGIVTDSVSIAA